VITIRSMSLAVALFALFLPAMPAQADNFVSFVSSAGNDANTCTRAAPCATLARAVAVTLSQGAIACLDAGPFDTNTIAITRSVTIDCGGGGILGSIELDSGATGISVNGSGIVVRIRNLRIHGILDSGAGAIGIDFQNGSELLVENCLFHNIRLQVNGGPLGIRFRPSAPASQLNVSDTIFDNNGTGSDGGGIVVQPTGSGSAKVTLDRVHVDHNITGVFFNAASGQTIEAVIKNSTVSGNAFTGVYALSGGGIIRTTIERSTINNNGGIGVLAQGANAFVAVTGTTITANNTGWTFSGGGNLITYLDNKVSLNLASDGAPSASLGSQ
jgi:hypothetical protein